MPTPTYQVVAETKSVAEPIAGPKAAQPVKGGPARGKAKGAKVRSKHLSKAAILKAKEAKKSKESKESKARSSQRKAKSGR
jgi:hypothetical protein